MNDRNAMNGGLTTIQPEDLEKVAGGFSDEWPCGNDPKFWKCPPQPREPWASASIGLDPTQMVSLNAQSLPAKAAVSNGFAM
jgi:hypothetical protein